MGQNAQIFIGTGSGKCGSISLSKLLNNCENVTCSHELRPLLDWKENQPQIDVRIKYFQGFSHAVGDVGHYYLPHLEKFIKAIPDIKVVILKRNKNQTVNSFLRNVRKRNHWTTFDGWLKDAEWDKAFPSYQIHNKEQAIKKYWEDYYKLAKHLEKEYPENVRLWDIDILNSREGQKKIFDFIGIPKENRNYLDNCRFHVSGHPDNVSKLTMKIGFIWDGVWRYGARWKDGLWAAMRILEKKHNIKYFEVDEKSREEVKDWYPDVILYWGAFTEEVRPEILKLPFKKACCFAGGRISWENSKGWNLVFTESQVNDDELGRLKVPFMRAFGTNEMIYRPMNLEKKYDAMKAGTFANWKRYDIFAQAVGEKGLAVGIHQKVDREQINVCKRNGLTVLDEQPREKIAEFINQSYCVVNCASEWGGGQRLTLEAMACNVPPIVMKDSPKNCEYVQESGFGMIVEPKNSLVADAIQQCKDGLFKGSTKGREYIKSKWTAQHYADNLEKGLYQIVFNKRNENNTL